MKKSTYAKIYNLGASPDILPANENPLSYCLVNATKSAFLHGGTNDYGPESKKCQMYMSDYCAAKWDGFCEYASQNTIKDKPSTLTSRGGISELTVGEGLIRNTAMKRYRVLNKNCIIRCEPFDPTVANSPFVCYESPESLCAHQYEIKDPSTIDSDVVMNKLLMRPDIAPDILLNIYNTMNRKGTLESLGGTKLGEFFSSTTFQNFIRLTR